MSKKVLIIEDDQLVANIYRNRLAVEGFTVEVANSGEAGLEQLNKFSPEAVILDLILPNLSGLDVIKKIRSQGQFLKLPIIVFSNTYLSTMVQEAWKAGATKCLSKANCAPKEVVEAVRNVFGKATEATPKPAVVEPRAKLGGHTTITSKAEISGLAEPSGAFTSAFPEAMTKLRQAIPALAKAATDADKLNVTQEIYRRVHNLTGAAHLAGLPELAQLAEALEALVMELHEKPNTINASTLRTLAAAIDFLPILSEPSKGSAPAASAPKHPLAPNILVVDDEPISRRAVTHALERAKLKSVGVDDPQMALKLLSETTYDLVFLDVDMPGMNGHELCTKLRALPRHKKTPVVFVTSLNDFQNRANSTMSGGNDFIAKPFPFLELAVKSLVYVYRGKYATAKTA
jgi:DNA-binding response OmpR family regulator/HPt (histidine-containing phosphotransfer) domain-containing protein